MPDPGGLILGPRTGCGLAALPPLGQDEVKTGSSRLTLHLHLSAMVTDDLPYDRETEPGPSGFSMGREGFEQPSTNLLGDSGTIIREGHQDGIILGSTFHTHHETTWLPLEGLRRISGKVVNRTLQPVLVEMSHASIFEFEHHLDVTRAQVLR